MKRALNYFKRTSPLFERQETVTAYRSLNSNSPRSITNILRKVWKMFPKDSVSIPEFMMKNAKLQIKQFQSVFEYIYLNNKALRSYISWSNGRTKLAYMGTLGVKYRLKKNPPTGNAMHFS